MSPEMGTCLNGSKISSDRLRGDSEIRRQFQVFSRSQANAAVIVHNFHRL